MSGETMRKAGQSEALFIARALKGGWEIAKPFHHAQGYDFVIKRSVYGWETVQVKTAYADRDGRRKPNRTASLRRCNEKGSRPYQKGDYELLAVVDENEIWLIPFAIIVGKSSIVISSKKYVEYKLD